MSRPQKLILYSDHEDKIWGTIEWIFFSFFLIEISDLWIFEKKFGNFWRMFWKFGKILKIFRENCEKKKENTEDILEKYWEI